MKRLQFLLFTLLAAIVLVFQCGCDKRAQDRQACKAVFGKVVTAGKDKDGTTYASLVTASELEKAGKIRKLALSAKKIEFPSMPVTDRYAVLLVRLMGSKADIKDLDDRGFVQWQVNAGLAHYNIQPEGIFSLGKITFTSDTEASGVISRASKAKRTTEDFDEYRSVARVPTPYSFRFLLEGNQWKLDASGFGPAIEYEIKKRMKATGQPDDLAILQVLAEGTGQNVPLKIWSGMLR